jgi:hypothetical protein
MMIDREQWSQIYDMARYNGVSPFRLLKLVAKPYVLALSLEDEEAIYQACLLWSRNRTGYLSEENWETFGR